MMTFNIEYFAPPLKRELPLLQYDIALYCSEFCKWTNGIWPEYLHDFQEKIFAYAAQLNQLRPQVKDISSDIRIYILDHRLHLLFAALDDTGKIATYMSCFCAQYKRHDVECHYYGDGSKAFDFYPCRIDGQLCFRPNLQQVSKFNRQYGFVPSELFADPVVLIFQQDVLTRADPTTMEHCILLMEKYHSKNLVDLKAIVRNVRLDAPISFY